MICIPCRNTRHEHCDNLYDFKGQKRPEPTKTWCDCEHRSNTTFLDQAHCNHLKWDDTMLYCPSCGKVLDDQNDSNREAPSIPDVVKRNKAQEAFIQTDPEAPGKQRNIASERHPETPSR